MPNRLRISLHLLIFVGCVLTASDTHAQFLKRFNIGFSIGPAAGIPQPNGSSTAVGMNIGFLLNRHFNFVFVEQSAGVLSFSSGTSVDSYNFGLQYFFEGEQVRPYIGLTAGPYKSSIWPGLFSNDPYSSDESWELGMCPEVGLKVYFITVAATYNFAGESTVLMHDGQTTYQQTSSNSYFAIKAGVLLGWFNRK